MPSHDPQMLKGVLSLLLLRLLLHEDGYGYGVVTRLQGAGFPDLVEGTVYPALTRLEAAGHLESYLLKSTSGPARKYYRITDGGRAELARAEAAWSDLVAAVAAVQASPTTPSPLQTQEA
ncbi:transcriptional regulator, PadR family [Austwickia chelonae]|uniref:Putative PadR family transcriptional regulator n=1 Tax=Austwickia chelonae NBRC 105200 TaxID=1184607 RepID=K6W744_9MICO|nr:PadR family transcriptional regulator [Austwickia chelonae]GAB77647.1 putative PadR family transcriptional regulator [Austwickia chelonae NBRC 105200]SEW14877.1 transcriptional regulator, PadR family [Austwickia chelonae]